MFFLIFVPVVSLLATVVTVTAITVVILVDSWTYEASLADNPTVIVAEDPVSAEEARQLGWPTRRDDGDRAFYMQMGANIIWPSWVSCEDELCLVGDGDRVVVFDTHPRLKELAEFPDVSKKDRPFETLVEELGLTENQAARLLTPSS